MATAAATREGSTKGREKTGRSKSEPSSTSDLLRPTARIDQFLLMHSARLDNWREITGLAEKWQAGAAQRADLDAAVAAMEAVEAITPIPGRNSSPCCASGSRRTTLAARRVWRGGFRTGS